MSRRVLMGLMPPARCSRGDRAMGTREKLEEAGERLKEFDAALKHIDDRLFGAEEELTAQVTDQTPPTRARRHHTPIQPTANPVIKTAL